MSRLYLHCAFCGRRQADGLLSRAHWGHVVLPDGSARQVCPACKSANADWETAVVASAEGRVAAVYDTEYGSAGNKPRA
ncbi:MAG: hypothetical protein M3327_07120 [Actinomycetota bacterium]|nr:hypothetical protein [Actinomycetota bacterium]